MSQILSDSWLGKHRKADKAHHSQQAAQVHRWDIIHTYERKASNKTQRSSNSNISQHSQREDTIQYIRNNKYQIDVQFLNYQKFEACILHIGYLNY